MQLAKTKLATAVGAVLVAACFTSTAYAGCGSFDLQPAPNGQQAAPSQPSPEAPGVNGFKGVQFVQAAATASFLRTDWRWDDAAPIVGMWHFQFIVANGTPQGVVIDDGFATWHEDGTEIMNSGRAPKTSNFCMGVWKRAGAATFSLNHFALSWTDDGEHFIGPTNIRETVTVDRRGNTYTGTFSITQYDTDGKTKLGGVSGAVKGTRINP
ncbi:MAG: hypothetical protein ABI640_18485 [Gammaproteobacteria bacterium]